MKSHTLARAAGLSFLALTTISSMAYASDEQRLICTELGITAEAMAAFGMNSVQAGAALDRVDELSIQIGTLRTLQEERRTAASSLKQAQKNVRVAESQSDAQQIEAQIDQLQQTLSSLAASIEVQQDLIRASILPVGLDAATVEWVCEPEGVAAFVPVEFRFVHLIESDYTDLLPALGAEQMALAAGESVDTGTQLILSGYRNLPAIQAARSNMLYNLDAVRGVFYD